MVLFHRPTGPWRRLSWQTSQVSNFPSTGFATWPLIASETHKRKSSFVPMGASTSVSRRRPSNGRYASLCGLYYRALFQSACTRSSLSSPARSSAGLHAPRSSSTSSSLNCTFRSWASPLIVRADFEMCSVLVEMTRSPNNHTWDDAMTLPLQRTAAVWLPAIRQQPLACARQPFCLCVWTRCRSRLVCTCQAKPTRRTQR